MQIAKLMKPNKVVVKQAFDCEITGLSLDSRKVEPGHLFIAVPGTHLDGRTFIEDALKRGAKALLIPANTQDISIPAGIAVYTADDMRAAAAAIAATFYPRQPENIAAITGTSGKTSTAQFTMELWGALGYRAASIGTLGLVTPEGSHYGSLTTPDAITLHKLLDEVVQQKITHVAMETSSVGLVQKRLDQVKFQIGAFTNLSRDHLDYHKTMEDYFAAKVLLFTNFLPEGSVAVLNADIPEYEILANHSRNRLHKIISFGKQGNDIRLLDFEPTAHGQRMRIEVLGKNYDVQLPVIGSFQVWNSLCALGLIIGSGGDPQKAIAGLEKLSGVPGRLQLIGKTAKGGAVFVDYAHKPDAMQNVLNGLRPHVAAHKGAKLGIVFGCGGNRDTGKRPIMGEIAQRLADWVIVTDDNPRNEDPALIRRAVLAGCAQKTNLREIGDRALAIQEGVNNLDANDILVIAGKGHEVGQIVGDKTLPFDDAAVAREAMGIKK